MCIYDVYSNILYTTNWLWFGTMEFWMTFHSVGNGKSSQLAKSIIFQRGRYTTNQYFNKGMFSLAWNARRMTDAKMWCHAYPNAGGKHDGWVWSLDNHPTLWFCSLGCFHIQMLVWFTQDSGQEIRTEMIQRAASRYIYICPCSALSPAWIILDTYDCCLGSGSAWLRGFVDISFLDAGCT
jgi:hypothetical protein